MSRISPQIISITTGRTYKYGDLVWAIVPNHPNGHAGKVMGVANVNDLWVHYIVRLNKFKSQDRYITVRHDHLKPRTKSVKARQC